MNERATDVFVHTINLLTVISDDSIQIRASVAIRLLSYFLFLKFRRGAQFGVGAGIGHLIAHLLIYCVVLISPLFLVILDSFLNRVIHDTQVKKYRQIHKIHWTGKRKRDDDISPTGVNKAGKTHKQNIRTLQMHNTFYHTFIVQFSRHGGSLQDFSRVHIHFTK